MILHQVSHIQIIRPGTGYFGGILLQEWDAKTKKLKGPVRNIYAGSSRGLVEGPHLFKRDGWYYLTTAEGGTGYEHAITYARSRKIIGPYETHPDLHLLTADGAPADALQRSGHGQMVFLKDGSTYHTHLTLSPPARPEAQCYGPRDGHSESGVWC